MKTTVLAAAFLAALAMPAFAEDAVKTDDAKAMTYIDPAKTGATSQDQTSQTTAKRDYSGCMKRHTALMM